MLVIHVHIHVKGEYIEAFKQATLENAAHSILEPGVARFDVVQQIDDQSWFVLVEVYRSADAPAKHKETPHYRRWANTVMEMMLEPRVSAKYTNLFPQDSGW